MNQQSNSPDAPVALVTGGALRIGSSIVNTLHHAGYNIIIHYRHAEAGAQSLAAELNNRRVQSAICLPADLNDITALERMASQAIASWGRIDALVNNASSFHPTAVGSTTSSDWDDLFGSNARAPFFLAQALFPELRKQRGAIVNIVDIYAERPLAQHSVYCAAKAANAMLVKSLARELAPDVRINGIAPGAILWPENGGANNSDAQQELLQKIPLGRTGSAQDIATTALFLLRDAPYITGQIIAVDGGRSINT